MATYGAMQTRIADELARADLTSQIPLAIKSAIAWYERKIFYFNETRDLTFSTIEGQEFYDSTDTAISFGDAAAFESATTTEIACCYDISNGKVVIAYVDGGNSNYGTAVVGTISDTDITFGTPVVFKAATTAKISCCFDSTNSKVVIAYRDNSAYGTAIVGTVSGTSISFGTAVVFESAAINWTDCCFDSNSSKVVIVYKDVSNSNYGTAIVGTVAGTAISFGTAVVFESAATSYIACCFDSNSNKVVVAYQDEGNSDYGTSIVGTVAATAISFGTAVVFESAASTFISCCFDSNLSKVVIAYRDGENNNCGTAIVGTVAATAISFGSAVLFERGSVEYTSCSYDTLNLKMIISFQDCSNACYGSSIVGTLSGTSISFDTAQVFENAKSNYIASCFDTTNKTLAIAYEDAGNSSYGTAIVGTGTDKTDLLNFVTVDDLTITLSATNREPLIREDRKRMERLSSDPTATGVPTRYSYYDQQFRFYPIPDGAYSIRVSGVKKLDELSANADTNAWMTDAEELIRTRAKWELFYHTIRDYNEAGAMEVGCQSAEKNLKEEDALRAAPQRIQPTEW